MNQLNNFVSISNRENPLNNEKVTSYNYLCNNKILALCFLLIHLIGFQIIGSLIIRLLPNMGITDIVELQIFATFLSDGIICLIYLGITIAVKPLRQSIFRTRFVSIGLMIGFVVVIYFLNNIGSTLIDLIVSQFTDKTSGNQTAIIEMIKLEPAIMIFTTVLLAPIAEEYSYRFGLVPLFGPNHKILAIIASGIVFALIHFDYETIMTAAFKDEALNIFAYLFAGCLFAYAYIRSESGVTSVAVHAANNLLATLSILLR